VPYVGSAFCPAELPRFVWSQVSSRRGSRAGDGLRRWLWFLPPPPEPPAEAGQELLAGVESLRLADNVRLTDLALEADTVVIAVYDPADCLECFGVAPAWRQWEVRAPTRRFFPVLTRVPDRVESRQFVLLSLPTRFVIHDYPPRASTPRVFWFEQGVVIDSAAGPSGERLLHRRRVGEDH
jgi:hypothetical protein